MPTNDDTALVRFKRQMFAELERYDRERRAEIIAAGGDPDDDPLEAVRDITDDYESLRDRPELGDFLDRLADTLDLDDIRTLRNAGELAQALTPQMIHAARANETPVPEIADRLGVTESYVYRILRTHYVHVSRTEDTPAPAQQEAANRAWARGGSGRTGDSIHDQ
jgi:hypothetical protein